MRITIHLKSGADQFQFVQALSLVDPNNPKVVHPYDLPSGVFRLLGLRSEISGNWTCPRQPNGALPEVGGILTDVQYRDGYLTLEFVVAG